MCDPVTHRQSSLNGGLCENYECPAVLGLLYTMHALGNTCYFSVAMGNALVPLNQALTKSCMVILEEYEGQCIHLTCMTDIRHQYLLHKKIHRGKAI